MTARRKSLCKHTACKFTSPADIHSLLRETYKQAEHSDSVIHTYDWKPRYLITPLEVKNLTNPFTFAYNPIKQES